jgi:hypothetical protein
LGVSKTWGENMFLFVHAKPFMSRYNNIKAKRKIIILYCTANQLIEVKVSFAFGYRIGLAGKSADRGQGQLCLWISDRFGR